MKTYLKLGVTGIITNKPAVLSGVLKKAAESVINAFKALRANLLVQEFIKEADGKDLRCFVIDGKVVASIERAEYFPIVE